MKDLLYLLAIINMAGNVSFLICPLLGIMASRKQMVVAALVMCGLYLVETLLCLHLDYAITPILLNSFFVVFWAYFVYRIRREP